MADLATKDDQLTALVRNFDSWFDATQAERAEAIEARDYYDGYQWTETELATLKARKQPPITDNKIKDKIDYLVGMEIASRSDPKAFPRTPTHEKDAEAVTDALRYVLDAQDFPKIRSDVAEGIMIEGVGGTEVGVKEGKGEIRVTIKQNRYERMYWDHHSSARDFSDATYLGTFAWLYLEQAEAKWPDKKALWDSCGAEMKSGGDESDSDRPNDVTHIDASKRRVRVIEQYYLKGKVWYRAMFVKHGWIEEPKPSDYLNDEGDPEHPYNWGSAYVDAQNRRYGTVRRWMGLQDEVNHRRTKSLHLLNTNQVIMEDGAHSDPIALRRELAKPDGVIVRTPGMELTVDKNIDLSAGHFQMMQQAIEALSIVGPKAITNVSASQSGRAKQLDRQSDALELGRLFDHLRQLQKQTCRKVWHRIKQYWTEEKWVRVRDDEGAPKFVQLNAPITAQDLYQQAQALGQPIPIELARMAQLQPTKPVGKRNDVATLDCDIIIDDMPDVVTLQEEQFANLVTLAQAGVIFPPDVYLDASALRNKKALKEKLNQQEDPAAQQAKAQEQELLMRAATAKIAKDEASAEKTTQEANQTKIENMAGMAGLAGMATG